MLDSSQQISWMSYFLLVSWAMSYKGPTCWHKISKDVLDCPTVSFQNSCIYHVYLSYRRLSDCNWRFWSYSPKIIQSRQFAYSVPSWSAF